MAMVIGVIAAVLLVASFLLSQGDGSNNAGSIGMVGIILFIVGALLHMRNRRNEQLEAMRGRGNDSKGNQNG